MAPQQSPDLLMDALNLGPLALPMPLVLGLLALTVAVVLARYPRWPHGAELESRLWLLALAGLLGARLAFVLSQWPHYAARPWTMIDIRDGGLTAWAGWLAVVLATLVMLWRHAAFRLRLPLAVASAALVWTLGTALVNQFSQGGTQLADLADLPLHTLDDQPARLGDLAEEPLVVNLWATWCPPCRREMPVFEAAQAQYPDVRFVLVNQGEEAVQVQAWLHNNGLALDHVWLDPGSALSLHADAVGLPTTLFFHADGRLAYRRMGEVSAATLARQVEALQGGGSTH